jgi:hypothetical protein
MPAEGEAHLCELRRRHPDWGQRRLAYELARAGIHPPGLTSIYRALLRNGLIQPHTRRRRKADHQRWSEPGRWSSGSWTPSAASGGPTAASSRQ